MTLSKTIAAAMLGLGCVALPAAYAADTGESKTQEAKDWTANKADHAKQATSDSAVTTKVKAAFVKDSTLSATAIHVTTKNGVTTLTGTVPSSAQKSQAATVAKQIDGVKSVNNNIKVSSTAK
jgi:hyperosmotically inducible protein